jgi:hypothetical protein
VSPERSMDGLPEYEHSICARRDQGHSVFCRADQGHVHRKKVKNLKVSRNQSACSFQRLPQS